MVYYKKCCCCLKSKVGAKVIGWLYLIGSVLSLISVIIRFALTYQNLRIASHHAYRHELFGSEALYKIIQNYITVWFAGYLIVDCVWIGFCVLFLLGIHKGNHCMMLPWMILNMIGLVVSVILKDSLFSIILSAEY